MKSIFLRLHLAVVLLIPLSSFSQVSDWVPVFLTPTGNHVLNGVETYFQRGSCNGDEVVYIKFVNTNNYPVTLTWHNAVFTQDIQWIHHESDIKSILIPANSSEVGSCDSTTVMTVNLSEFVNDPAQFKRFCTVALNITNSSN